MDGKQQDYAEPISAHLRQEGYDMVLLIGEQLSEMSRKVLEIRTLHPRLPVLCIVEEQESPLALDALWKDGASAIISPPNADLLQTTIHHFSTANASEGDNSASSLLRLRQALSRLFHLREPGPSALPADRPAALQAYFFGGFSLRYGGKKLPLKLNTRAKSILAYLIFHAPRSIHRDRLVETFWPDTSLESGRNLLHVSLSHIRRWSADYLPNVELIRHHHSCYAINGRLELQTDFGAFQSYFQQALQASPSQRERKVELLTQAYRLYRGHFLEDLYNEPWVSAYRSDLENSYLDVLNYLAEQLMAEGWYDLVGVLARKILEYNAHSEAAHRYLMQTYYQQGLRDKVLTQYQRYRAAIEEIRMKPSAEILALVGLVIDLADKKAAG